jgi:hypothetical protein
VTVAASTIPIQLIPRSANFIGSLRLKFRNCDSVSNARRSQNPALFLLRRSDTVLPAMNKDWTE